MGVVPIGKFSKRKRDALHCRVGSLAGFDPPPLSLSQSAAEWGGNNVDGFTAPSLNTGEFITEAGPSRYGPHILM